MATVNRRRHTTREKCRAPFERQRELWRIGFEVPVVRCCGSSEPAFWSLGRTTYRFSYANTRANAAAARSKLWKSGMFAAWNFGWMLATYSASWAG